MESPIDSVSLSRRERLRRLRGYGVTLRSDGTALLRADPLAGHARAWEGQFFESDYMKIMGFAERCGFWDWENAYGEVMADQPIYVINIKREGKAKTVLQQATDEPRDFWVLAKVIDALAAKASWSIDVGPLTSRRGQA